MKIAFLFFMLFSFQALACPACPSGSSLSGTGAGTNLPGCKCTNGAATWNGSACVTGATCPGGASTSGTGDTTNVAGCRCDNLATNWDGFSCVQTCTPVNPIFWTVGGQTCQANITGAGPGAFRTVSDSTGPTTGTGQFQCTTTGDNSFSQLGSSTCTSSGGGCNSPSNCEYSSSTEYANAGCSGLAGPLNADYYSTPGTGAGCFDVCVGNFMYSGGVCGGGGGGCPPGTWGTPTAGTSCWGGAYGSVPPGCTAAFGMDSYGGPNYGPWCEPCGGPNTGGIANRTCQSTGAFDGDPSYSESECNDFDNGIPCY